MAMSLKCIDEQIAAAKRHNDTKAVCGLYISKGDVLMDTCPEQAIEEYLEALRLLRGFDSDDEMLAHRRLGECYISLGNFDQSRKHLKNYLDMATEKGSLLEQQRAWTTIGRSHHAQHVHDPSRFSEKLALDAYMKSLQLAQEMKDMPLDGREYGAMKGRALYNIALLKEPAEAVPMLESALYLFKRHELNEDLCRCLSHMIDTHLGCDEGAAALQLCDKYLEAAQAIKREDLKGHAYLMKGIAQLHVGHFDDARESLKRSYKKKSEDDNRTRVRRYLKLSTMLREYCAALSRAETASERCRLQEEVADLLVKFDMYNEAIRYYKSAVETGVNMDIDSKKLAELHASIATSYKDLKNYELALKHFERELLYRGDEPGEKGDTKMLMAQVTLAMSPNETATAYNMLSEALQHYQRAGSKESEEKCLKALKTLAEESKILGSEDSEDESSTQSSKLSDLDDDDISECSDSDPEVNGLLPRRKYKRIDEKVNYKGETPLHLAAIEGNLKRVKQLLKLNHSVNVRDNCGWTPLHEAANHGHLEVCKCLIELGKADINDAGGDRCGGVTPLHDAIVAEQLDVALYLLAKGASVNAQTSDKKTPLDILLSVKKKHGDNLSQEDKRLISNVEHTLREKMANVSSAASVMAGTRCAEPNVYVVDSLSPQPCCDESGDHHTSPISEKTKDKVQGAWVDEAEEEWCIDDLSKPRSRQRRLRQTKLNVSCKRSSSSKISSRCKVRKTTPSSNDAEQETTVDMDFNEGSEEQLSKGTMEEVPEPPKPASMRPSLRVRICDKLLLVPAPPEKSIAWLAEEAAERYYELVGIRPKLNITLSDGAVASTLDTLQCLLDCGSVNVIGEVVSWNVPPLVQRYKNACEKDRTPTLENLIPVLEECESRGIFSLRFACIDQVKQVFSALRHQQNLHTLDIRGTRLNASSIPALASSLATFQSLYSLCLRCVGLTSELLRILADSSPGKVGAFELDLSFNYIGGDGTTALGQFLACFPKLKALELSDCSITDFGTSLQSLSMLQKLDVSDNPLSDGAATVLRSVMKSNAIKCLNISNCFSRLRSTILRTLFSDPTSCGLREINLSCSNLEADDVDELVRHLPRGSLVKLNVTGNPSLAGSSLDTLCSELAGIKVVADATC